MNIFKLEKHNYWQRHIEIIWAAAVTFPTFQGALKSLSDQNARSLLLLIFELSSNVNELLYPKELDYIPINFDDMQVVQLLLNNLFEVKGLPQRIELAAGAIRYTN